MHSLYDDIFPMIVNRSQEACDEPWRLRILPAPQKSSENACVVRKIVIDPSNIRVICNWRRSPNAEISLPHWHIRIGQGNPVIKPFRSERTNWDLIIKIRLIGKRVHYWGGDTRQISSPLSRCWRIS